MTPTLTKFEPADSALTDAVLRGDLYLGASVGSDFKNLLVGQFGVAVALPALVGAMANLVRVVSSTSIPTQVGRCAVSSVAIVVSALHSIWAWAMKRCCDKSVDVISLGDSIDLEIDPQVSPRLMQEWLSDYGRHTTNRVAASLAVALAALNSSEVTHHEKWFEADDRLPDFFHTKEHAMNMQQSSNDADYGVAKNHSVAW